MPSGATSVSSEGRKKGNGLSRIFRGGGGGSSSASVGAGSRSSTASRGPKMKGLMGGNKKSKGGDADLHEDGNNGVVMPKQRGGSASAGPPGPSALRPSSVASPSPAATSPKATNKRGVAPAPEMLKVVLLLMDAVSRRFELLQLEFDSMKATVVDVLAQIPHSVTEDVLRKQTYVGICGHDGVEMHPKDKLASFCSGNDVLVAIPKGVQAKEYAKLARPILSDDKVYNMLMASGINVKPWKAESIAKRPPGAAPSPGAPASPGQPRPKSALRTPTTSVPPPPVAPAAAAAAAVPNVASSNKNPSATSVASAPAAVPTSTPVPSPYVPPQDPGQSSNPYINDYIQQQQQQQQQYAANQHFSAGSSVVSSASSLSSAYKMPGYRSSSSRKSRGSSGLAYRIFFLKAIVIFAVTMFVQIVHRYISAPIQKGDVLSPGIWISKCGLFSFWPTCDNSYLKIDDNEGVLSLYTSDNRIAWEMKGGTCAGSNTDGQGGEGDCVRGLQFNHDGSLFVGGAEVEWVTVYNDAPLSPWPFAEEPKVKVWKK